MEKKKECEIVQDLLLGYVDETLNKESINLVEKHLNECESCRERLNEIREDINESQHNQQKEIDYLKKIRIKSKVKSVLIAISIIVIVIFILYINKFIKISSIMNKANKILESQNYYSEKQEIIGDGKVAISKVYYKDGKYKNINEIHSDEETKIQFIVYGEVGKEYYILRNQFEKDGRWEVWIDKETGLVIREIQRDGEKRFIAGTDIVKEIRDCTTIYKYELNGVKDQDVTKPDST